MQGYITLRLPRQLLSDLRKAGPIAKLVYLEFLELARFTDIDGVERGSFICSRERLARHIGISEKQLRTAVKKLKALSLIGQAKGQETLKRAAKITIINYDTICGVRANTETRKGPSKGPSKTLEVNVVRNSPLPPQAGGLAAPEPHDGRHPSCRDCKTNRRAKTAQAIEAAREAQNKKTMDYLRQMERDFEAERLNPISEEELIERAKKVVAGLESGEARQIQALTARALETDAAQS